MSGRGWYAEKETKLKKEKTKQRKNMNAISACADGYTRRAEGKNDWMGNGTRTHSIYTDVREKEKTYPQELAMEMARKLCAKYGVAM